METKTLRLLELVRRTKRYGICECQPGQFEVMDERYLLDRLRRMPVLRPVKYDSTQIEFDEGLEAVSEGPGLTEDDREMLGWLMSSVEMLDPNSKNAAFNAAYEGAVLFRGTLDQVEYFMRAALDHRVQ